MQQIEKYQLNLDSISKVERVPGVYIIYIDKYFPRLKSKTNIVYIGKANDLKKRLLTFPREKGRKAIQRFLTLQRNGFNLLFSIQKSDDPKQLERRCLAEYEKQHLELPPLNRKN